MNIFKKAQIKLMPEKIFKEIGSITKVEFDGKNNRVFVGLRYPVGGLTQRAASDPKRVAMFKDMLEKLKVLGFQDIVLDDRDSDPSWPVDSVFIPIDLEKHSANRKIMKKMYGYTDYYKHSHSVFPKDWENTR